MNLRLAKLQALCQQAVARQEVGNDEGAIIALEEARRLITPEDEYNEWAIMTRFNLAGLYARHKRYEEAMTLYGRVAQMNARLLGAMLQRIVVSASTNRARCLIELQRHADAASSLRETLRQYSTERWAVAGVVDATLMLGRLFERDGQTAEARDQYRAAATLVESHYPDEVKAMGADALLRISVMENDTSPCGGAAFLRDQATRLSAGANSSVCIELAKVLSNAAAIAAGTHCNTLALEAAEAAVVICQERVTDEDTRRQLLAQVLVNKGIVLRPLDNKLAADVLRAAAEAAGSVNGSSSIPVQLKARVNLADCLFEREDYGAAEAEMEEAWRLGSKSVDRDVLDGVLYACMSTGDRLRVRSGVPSARRWYERGWDAWLRSGRSERMFAFNCKYRLAQDQEAEGDYGSTLVLLEAALSTLEDPRTPQEQDAWCGAKSGIIRNLGLLGRWQEVMELFEAFKGAAEWQDPLLGKTRREWLATAMHVAWERSGLAQSESQLRTDLEAWVIGGPSVQDAEGAVSNPP